jgi:hypothetical protein
MRWQKELEFQKALRQARRAAFGQAIARLQQMSGAAVATLGKMMAKPSVQNRLGAGGTIAGKQPYFVAPNRDAKVQLVAEVGSWPTWLRSARTSLFSAPTPAEGSGDAGPGGVRKPSRSPLRRRRSVPFRRNSLPIISPEHFK